MAVVAVSLRPVVAVAPPVVVVAVVHTWHRMRKRVQVAVAVL